MPALGQFHYILFLATLPDNPRYWQITLDMYHQDWDLPELAWLCCHTLFDHRVSLTNFIDRVSYKNQGKAVAASRLQSWSLWEESPLASKSSLHPGLQEQLPLSVDCM